MRVVLIAFLNLMQIPTLLFYGLAIGIALAQRSRMRQFFWYLVQSGIILGAVQFYVSTGPHTFPMSAMLFVAGLTAFAVTDLSVRGYDWVRRRRLARRYPVEKQPAERIERGGGADRNLQRRLAGSVEFRRAVEGTQRQIER